MSRRHRSTERHAETRRFSAPGLRRAAKKKKKERRNATQTANAQEVLEEDNVQDEDLHSILRQLQRDIRKHRGSCEEKDFRRMVDHLQTMCPPPKRCRVSVKRLPSEEMTDEYGYVLKERDRFEIYLDKSLTEYETEHVLLHEWAHMLAWQPYHPLMGDHSPNWGVWYALVWRKYHACE